jgi:hypothetical protein
MFSLLLPFPCTVPSFGHYVKVRHACATCCDPSPSTTRGRIKRGARAQSRCQQAAAKPTSSYTAHPMLPHALLFFLAAYASTSPAVSAGDGFGAGGRMVVVRGTAGVDSRVTWQPRRLEDDVAPEFPSDTAALLRGSVKNGPLNPDRPACPKKQHGCAAKDPGHAYTRPCTYVQRCPQGHD